MFSGDHRFIGNYRRQWASVPVDYRTISASYDTKFYDKNYANFFAGGLVLNHDLSGDGDLKLVSVGLTGAYTKMLTDHHFLTFGLQAGAIQRSLSVDNFQFDNQYDPGSWQYNDDLATGEGTSKYSKTIPDISAGINYHFQVPTKRTAVEAGLGIYHLTEPNKSFFEDASETLDRRYSMYGIGTFQLSHRADLLLHATQSFQGPHAETFAGFGGRFHLNTNRDRELALSLNLNFRLRNRDALIPVVGLRYRNWQAAFSYDINTSDFNTATGNNGGPEFSLIHVITTVKPVKTKICPIYL